MVFETIDSAGWSIGASSPDRQARGRCSPDNVPPPGSLLGVSQNALRVVIAEDEALIRLDLKEMLEEEGYSEIGRAHV